MLARTTSTILIILLCLFTGGCKNEDDPIYPWPRAPHIAVAPSRLDFSAVSGGELPPSQSITITNTGEGVFVWAITTTEDWIECLPLSGAAAAQCGIGSGVSVSVTTADLPEGVYEGAFVITGCPADNSPVSVPVTYTVSTLDTAFSIEDAWWREIVDQDGNGYAESARLVWDADVSDGSTRTVNAQVFYREACDAEWSYYATTPCMTIVGDADGDTASVVVDHLPQGTFEFSILLYECGLPPIVAARGRADDADLGSRRFETIITFSVYDAWWTGETDYDGDQCREFGRLWWDVDVDDDGDHLVQAHLYYRPVGSDAWVWYHSTDCWTVSGKSEDDARSVEIVGLQPGVYEFIIDVYECGGHGKAAEWSFADDPDLADQCFDEPIIVAFTIADAWWEDVLDADADGFAEQRTLACDVDLGAGLRTASVSARVYVRGQGESAWTYIFGTACWTVTATGPHDTYRMEITGIGPDCYDFLIRIYDCATRDTVATRADGDDDDLADQCFERPAP